MLGRKAAAIAVMAMAAYSLGLLGQEAELNVEIIAQKGTIRRLWGEELVRELVRQERAWRRFKAIVFWTGMILLGLWTGRGGGEEAWASVPCGVFVCASEAVPIVFENEFVRLERRGNEVIIQIGSDVRLDLNLAEAIDRDVLVVYLRLLKTPDGKAVMKHREIAEFFGFDHRQNVDNRLQEYRRAGRSLSAFCGPGAGRPPELSEQACRLILERWIANPELTAVEMHKMLLEEGVIEGIEGVSVETVRRAVSSVDHNFVRRRLKQLVEKGKVSWSEPGVVAVLTGLVEELQGLLASHGLLPKATAVSVACALQRARSGKESAGADPRTAPAIDAGRLQEWLLGDSHGESIALPPRQDDVACPDCHTNHTTRKTSHKANKRLGPVKVSEVHETRCCMEESCSRKTFTIRRCDTDAHLRFATSVALLYGYFRSSIGRIAGFYGLSKSQVYRMLVAFGRVALEDATFMGKVRFSGTACIDEKWVKLARSRKDRKRNGKWVFLYVAVDPITLDLLHHEVFDSNGSEATKAFLLGLKQKGYNPRVIVTDGLLAYDKVIREVFTSATHHLCTFHAQKNVREKLREAFGKGYRNLDHAVSFMNRFDAIFQPEDKRTAKSRCAKLMADRSMYEVVNPVYGKLLDGLQSNLDLLVNAVGSTWIPLTNNAAELVIRQFDLHYQTMAGLGSLQTARIQANLWALVYRFSPLTNDARPEFRGLCPLDIAGYEVQNTRIYRLLNSTAACEIASLVSGTDLGTALPLAPAA